MSNPLNPKRYVDRDGKLLTLDEFLELHNNYAYVKVDESYVPGANGHDVRVSTVWMGSRFSPYETRVFGGKLDDLSRQYFFVEDAVKGHKEILAEVEEAEGDKAQPDEPLTSKEIGYLLGSTTGEDKRTAWNLQALKDAMEVEPQDDDDEPDGVLEATDIASGETREVPVTKRERRLSEASIAYRWSLFEKDPKETKTVKDQ